jgi:hypothetical protein
MNYILSLAPYFFKIILILSHLRLCLTCSLFLSNFPIKSLYPFLISPMRATCSTHHPNNIVTYPGFAWLITLIRPLLYNWLQQFRNHYVAHCHLLQLDTLDFWPHFTTPLLCCTCPVFWFCHLITPRHGPPGKHRLLLSIMRAYWSVSLEMDVLLLSAYASWMCLTSRCLAMTICVTIFKVEYTL